MNRIKASCMVLFLTVVSVCARPQKREVVFVGNIQFPQHITSAPEMKALYKGNVYDIEVDEINQGIGHSASFQMTEESDCKEFYILVTPDLKRPYSNNFVGFKTSSLHSYRLFRLTRYRFAQENEDGKTELYESWNVQEYTKNDEMIDLPDNTLILLMNPDHIQTFKETPVKAGELATLPQLYLKDDLTQKNVNDMGVAMELALVNLKPFHTRRGKRVLQVAQNHIVSLNYNNS